MQTSRKVVDHIKKLLRRRSYQSMNCKPVGDCLANAFTALEAWVDALPTDWNTTVTHTVPLPSNLSSEDIRRVALYATTVDDAEILCRRIDVQNPKRSFAPLLLLSEMISFVHPRLRTVVQEHLKSDTVLNIAINGHAQCREPAGRLFLRLWGATLSQQHAPDIVCLLYNSLESLKSEALVCISFIATNHPLHLYSIREALKTGESVTDDTLLVFFRLYQQRTENTRIKDSIALLLLWLFAQNLSQWWTYSLSINDVLKIVIERCKESDEVHIQLALLDGLSDLCMNSVTLESVYSCGGIALLSDLLNNMRHCSFFHEAFPFHDSIETPFESIAKQAQCLTQYPEARCKIKSSDIPSQLADVARDQGFLQHERSRSILETYLQPILADVDSTPSS